MTFKTANHWSQDNGAGHTSCRAEQLSAERGCVDLQRVQPDKWADPLSDSRGVDTESSESASVTKKISRFKIKKWTSLLSRILKSWWRSSKEEYVSILELYKVGFHHFRKIFQSTSLLNSTFSVTSVPTTNHPTWTHQNQQVPQPILPHTPTLTMNQNMVLETQDLVN